MTERPWCFARVGAFGPMVVCAALAPLPSAASPEDRVARAQEIWQDSDQSLAGTPFIPGTRTNFLFSLACDSCTENAVVTFSAIVNLRHHGASAAVDFANQCPLFECTTTTRTYGGIPVVEHRGLGREDQPVAQSTYFVNNEWVVIWVESADPDMTEAIFAAADPLFASIALETFE